MLRLYNMPQEGGIMEYLSHSLQETSRIAAELSKTLPRGTILLLQGDLGAGKTAFARGFVSSWGMEELVSSPTFTVMNEYRNEQVCICHYDLYRLSSAAELQELGLEEALESCDYTLIEWPDLARDIITGQALVVDIRLGSTPSQRQITLTGAEYA